MGTFVIEPKSINISELMDSSIKDNQSKIINKKLLIDKKEEGDISNFQADEKLLRIIFQNLLSNAVKYTDSEGLIKIYLASLKAGQNFGERNLKEDCLVFSIEDSGMGIPASQQDKIFTKLFRADNAKESENEGTGLGLYVIKLIIDKAGGDIWFKSEQGKGTIFYITFPISGMKIKE